MEYFLELCDEFCINQEKIKEYGILTNIDSSKDIKKCLTRLDLEENEHYQVGQVSQQSNTSRGIKYSNKYTLTPVGFKLALIYKFIFLC